MARVSDEVWQRLDRNAGRLGGRRTVRVWIAVGVAVVTWMALYGVWSTGAVVPHLVRYSDPQATREPDGVVRVDLAIGNHGLAAVTLLAVGRSGPGLELVRVEPTFPLTMPSSGPGLNVALTYRVTDCAAVPRGSWPLTATVERFWGALTVDVGPFPGEQDRWQEEASGLICG